MNTLRGGLSPPVLARIQARPPGPGKSPGSGDRGLVASRRACRRCSQRNRRGPHPLHGERLRVRPASSTALHLSAFPPGLTGLHQDVGRKGGYGLDQTGVAPTDTPLTRRLRRQPLPRAGEAKLRVRVFRLSPLRKAPAARADMDWTRPASRRWTRLAQATPGIIRRTVDSAVPGAAHEDALHRHARPHADGSRQGTLRQIFPKCACEAWWRNASAIRASGKLESITGRMPVASSAATMFS